VEGKIEGPDLEQFGMESPDPARYIDRICERIAVLQASIEAQEHERRLDRAENDTGSSETQRSLMEW